jgi:hypothetical protein
VNIGGLTFAAGMSCALAYLYARRPAMAPPPAMHAQRTPEPENTCSRWPIAMDAIRSAIFPGSADP